MDHSSNHLGTSKDPKCLGVLSMVFQSAAAAMMDACVSRLADMSKIQMAPAKAAAMAMALPAVSLELGRCRRCRQQVRSASLCSSSPMQWQLLVSTII